MERFFNKDLDLDSHVSQLKPGSVRERFNMRIVSNSDGSYAVESVNGTKTLLNLNPNYQPIGWRTMGAKLVVFSSIKGASASTGNLEIGTFVVDETTMVGTYTPLYNHFLTSILKLITTKRIRRSAEPIGLIVTNNFGHSM